MHLPGKLGLGLFVACVFASLFLVLNILERYNLRLSVAILAEDNPPSPLTGSHIATGRLLVPGRNITVLLPKFILQGALSHAHFTVSIQANNSDGQLLSRCPDIFLVKVFGSALHSPVVTCKDGGVYKFRVDLVEPGAYNLSIRLGGSVAPVLSADHCYHYYDEGHKMRFDGVGEQESIHFKFRPEQPPASRSTQDMVNNDGSKTCSPEEFYHGRFVPKMRNYSIGGLQRFDWKPFRTSASCDWPAFWGRERSLKCLEGKWIAFIGDSTLLEIACDFVVYLYGSFDLKWADPHVPFRPGETCNRLWDTGRSRPDLPRVSVIFIGHWNMTQNCEGITSLWHPVVQGRLKHLFGDLTQPTPADVLFFNSGLHDVCGREPVERFPPSILTNFNRALSLVRKFGKELIWKTTSPRLQRCVIFFGFARAHWLDQQVVPMARLHGYKIADQYHLNIVAQDGWDGLHCTMGLTCWTFASSLMNFICPIS